MTEVKKKEESKDLASLEAELMVAETTLKALEDERIELQDQWKKILPQKDKEGRKELRDKINTNYQEIIKYRSIVNGLKVNFKDEFEAIEKQKDKKRYAKNKEEQKVFDESRKLSPEKQFHDYLEKNNIEFTKCPTCEAILYDNNLKNLRRQAIGETISNRILFNEMICISCGSHFTPFEIQQHKRITNLEEALELLIPELNNIKITHNDLISLIKRKFGGK